MFLSPSTFLVQLGVPPHQRMLVILNGDVVLPEAYRSSTLAGGDQLALMPPSFRP